jgi:PilZ domain
VIEAMALLDTDPASAPLTSENRRYQRVKVDLLGRYMLEDRREFPCQVINMSPGGVALIAPICGPVGERVIAYVDHIGRLEGLIARIFPSGFAMTIEASRRKRDKLAAQLTWLANRHILVMPEGRRHRRIGDLDQMVPLVLPDVAHERCAIIDLSLSGVAVVSLNRPPIGSTVRVGKAPGRVVRYLDSGFAVEFSRVQDPELLEATIAQA